MVHFVPADEADNTAARPAGVAPVTYLPGAGPGMKRRSPVETTPHARAREKTVFEQRATEPTSAEPTSAEFASAAQAQPDDVSDVDPDATERRERAEEVLLQRLRARSLSLVEAFAVMKDLDLDDGEAHDVIERFTLLAYLDDDKLADQIIHTHHVRKGLGRAGVETEMRRRKLDASIMLDKLEELPDDELERAIEEGTKRIAQLSRFDDQTIDRRLNAFLMRKGYNSQIVRVAVKAALDSRNGSSTVRFR
ncbi:regulatory protein RecX [Cryobacterium roopkundense]|uniref:Regulatory protein RecX n=1 Tax=Cryobacterium roopkundense TaxID=1001240 RepID=A0A7W8ZUC2_9MICO|nr:regulatory protein RecX [Cryobacterium roopkundense]MBB5640354.1 regulatory protein [Cryobacterium roopkundense]